MMQARRLSLRATLALCLFALLLAGVTAVVLWPGAAVSNTGWFAPALLPQFLTGAALLLAALGAPLMLAENELASSGWKIFAAKSALCGLWCGAAASFMLLAAARLTPLETSAALAAALWIASLATISMLLNAAFPRAAFALLFTWIVLPPVSLYLLLELFLSSAAGAAGLAETASPQAAALRTTLHVALNLSPASAAFGSLSGKLADGSDYSHALGALALVIAGSLALLALGTRHSALGTHLTPDSIAAL